MLRLLASAQYALGDAIVDPPNDDLEIIRKQKEIEKLAIEITNAKASVGLERFKAWAALLGPVMTAVTVLGTVYLGFLQISAKSASDEDTNWRQTITSINSIRPEDLNNSHLVTLLKPFFESRRYKTLVIGVTVDELPRIRDVGTFNELFSAAFPRPDAKDLPNLLNIGRKQNIAIVSLVYPSDKLRTPSNQEEVGVVAAEAAVICGPIADILRNSDHKALAAYFHLGRTDSNQIPLNDIYFERCDFSNVDFSDLDVANSTFEQVKLDGAILKNIKEHTPSMWNATIWWTAKEIDPDLLRFLLSNYKPYQFSDSKDYVNVYRDNEEIHPADWETNIRRLCAAAHLTCTAQQIKADFPNNH